MYEITFYDTDDGRTIDLLETNGPLLREPYSKYLEDGIFELRTKQGSDIARVLYFFVIGQRVVLTNGFIKKTQKIPIGEKNLAKNIRLIMNGGM